MGVLVGIIAKALLLSFLLVAVCFVIVIALKGEASCFGLLHIGLVLFLFLFNVWQGVLLIGAMQVKQFENHMIELGNASVSDLNTAMQALPLPDALRNSVVSGDTAVSEVETVRIIRKSVNNYIWKHIAWVIIVEIVVILLLCWLPEKGVPEKRNRTLTSGSYGNYRPSDDF